MIVWHSVKDIDIPGPVAGQCVSVLAIHKSKRYTSDVYMIWKWSDDTLARWPHHDLEVTHWAYFNEPEEDDGTTP